MVTFATDENFAHVERAGNQVRLAAETDRSPSESAVPGGLDDSAGIALIVDDDPTIRALLAEILADEGFQTAESPHGAAALEWLATHRPAVIFLDMRMPVMDGWAFAAEYRRRYDREVPIIVISAAQNAQKWCNEIGAEGCVAKPFELDDISGALAQVLNAA